MDERRDAAADRRDITNNKKDGYLAQGGPSVHALVLLTVLCLIASGVGFRTGASLHFLSDVGEPIDGVMVFSVAISWMHNLGAEGDDWE